MKLKTKSPMPLRLLWLIPLMALSLSAAKNPVFFNILDYKADPDGRKKCTRQIAMAVEDASEKGGGTVYFPAGTYLTGPIHLKSNITLFLDAGAVIRFSDDFEDYLPFVTMRWEGTVNQNFSPLIYGRNIENVAIIGRGTLDGQGRKWWEYYGNIRREMKETGKVSFNSRWQEMHREANTDILQPDNWNWTENQFLRPPMIQFFESRNIRIEGIFLKDSPFWTINPVFCDNVTVDGVTITAPPESHNTDGINPSSCTNVHISNSHISVGDDCITIKSGRDEDGRKWARPSENITITNCTMLNGHGGVVIGSEMSGDVRRVTISNCVFDGTDRGIRLKSMRGRGGVVENIRVSNIVMHDIVLEAFMMNMFYQKTDPEPVSERTPRFRNIHISDVVVTDAEQAGKLLGLDEMHIENISFSNLRIDAEKGFEMKNARNIQFSNVIINSRSGSVLFGKNISGLTMNAVYSDNPGISVPMLDFQDLTDAYITNARPAVDVVYLRLGGAGTQRIHLGVNDFSRISKALESGADVPADAVLSLVR